MGERWRKRARFALAPLADGTELVRIGEPRQPEFAAWQYGDRFGRRRNRQLLLPGGGWRPSAESTLAHASEDALAFNLRHKNGQSRFEGPEALRVASLVIPAVSRFGGSRPDGRCRGGRDRAGRRVGAFMEQLASRGEAAIADDMFVPAGVRSRIERLRGKWRIAKSEAEAAQLSEPFPILEPLDARVIPSARSS